MRASIKTLAVLALGTMTAAAFASAGFAADLNVKAKRHHAHRHHARVVADYDGTPIVIRRRRDGTADTIVVRRGSPTHYFNGEAIRAAGRRIVMR